jgi:hypothetical protein
MLPPQQQQQQQQRLPEVPHYQYRHQQQQQQQQQLKVIHEHQPAPPPPPPQQQPLFRQHQESQSPQQQPVQQQRQLTQQQQQQEQKQQRPRQPIVRSEAERASLAHDGSAYVLSNMELLQRHVSALYQSEFVTTLQQKSGAPVTVATTLSVLSKCRDSYAALSDDSERATGLELVCYVVNCLHHCNQAGLRAEVVLDRWECKLQVEAQVAAHKLRQVQ